MLVSLTTQNENWEKVEADPQLWPLEEVAEYLNWDRSYTAVLVWNKKLSEYVAVWCGSGQRPNSFVYSPQPWDDTNNVLGGNLTADEALEAAEKLGDD